MTSEFDTAMAVACGDITARLGRALTHTDGSAVSTAIAAGTFAETTPDRRAVADGRINARTAVVMIDAADVAAPAAGDIVTADGEDWTVIAVTPIANGDHFDLQLRRAEQGRKAPNTYAINYD